MKKNYHIIIILLGLISLAVFVYALYWLKNDELQTGKVANNPKRAEASFFRELSENGAVILYPSGSDYTDNLKKIVQAGGLRFRRIKFDMVPDTSITDKLLSGNNLIVLGSVHSNMLFKKSLVDFPLGITNEGFTILGRNFNNRRDVVRLLYKNPFNSKKFVFINSGNDDLEILKHISLFSNANFSITRGNKTLLMGNFKILDNNKWKIDKMEYWDFEKERKVYQPAGHFKFIAQSNKITRKEIKSISAKDEEALIGMQNFFGKSFKLLQINYNIYDSFEGKGLIINNTDISSYNPTDSSVDIVMNSKSRGDDFTGIAALLLRENFGIPKTTLLAKGLAMHFSREWKFKGYKYWTSKFYLSDNIPDLSELLDSTKSEYESPLLVYPVAGLFVDFLISKFGKEIFIRNYPNWVPGEFESNEFRNEWEKYLSIIANKFKSRIQKDRKNYPQDISSFLKGVSYAHTGYSIYNGYLSSQSFLSLQLLKSLGVNSISITPFTSIRFPNKPEPLRFWESPGAENDETMIFLKNAADSLQLTIMLKPHIWVGRGGWPGDIKMEDKDDWTKFFSNYYRWIRHYAILAEMYKIPILCIGNEMSQTTVGHEKEWIIIINKLRKLYDGKLTYGANWSKEFKDITFWNKLDYIGVSQYFPLSMKKNPTDEELLSGADSVISSIDKIHQKFNKPILFTEAGYRNSTTPWETALEQNPKFDSTGIEQAKAYDAMLQASYDKKWLVGIFWWKWPSNLDYVDFAGRDLYVPLSKPAQDVIKMWYHKRWN